MRKCTLVRVWVISVVKVGFERALQTAEAQWLRYFVHESKNFNFKLLVGWLILKVGFVAKIKSPQTLPGHAILPFCFAVKKTWILFDLFIFRRTRTWLHWCRFESGWGKKQWWNILRTVSRRKLSNQSRCQKSFPNWNILRVEFQSSKAASLRNKGHSVTLSDFCQFSLERRHWLCFLE